MWRFAIPLLGLSLLAGPATAQYYYNPPPPSYGQNFSPPVDSWYHRFLGRSVDPSGLQTWTQALAQGQTPQAVLATILGSQEYYDRAGGTVQGFIQQMYVHLLNRYPNQGEMNYWMGQANAMSNQDIASALLQQFPNSWQQPAPAYYGAAPAYGVIRSTGYYVRPRLRYW
jgi:hypothetical protein